MANTRAEGQLMRTVQLSSDELSCGICLNELALRVVQCPNSHRFCLTCIEEGFAINPSARP